MSQVTNGFLDSSLLLDCQDPLHNAHRGGIAVGDMLEERLDGGESGVAGADAVSSLAFKVIQKHKDESPIEVFDGHLIACHCGVRFVPVGAI